MTNMILQRIISAGIGAATTDGTRHQIQNIDFSFVAEPGYDPTRVIALGDWKNHPDDDVPERVANLLERVGVMPVWDDEWAVCNSCKKAVRTHPGSSTNWKCYCVVGDGVTLCGNCLKADPIGYLKSLEGSVESCLTIEGLNLEHHGYALVKAGFHCGLYDQKSARPELIGEHLREENDTIELAEDFMPSPE
jgi:hypothetical protein